MDTDTNREDLALKGLLLLRGEAAGVPTGGREHEEALADLRRWAEQGIFAVGRGDPRYPEGLLEIHEPPSVLFYRGELPEAISLTRSFSIVGSRRASTQSCQFAAATARELAAMGVSIISGLALGVDGAAHTGALESESHLPTVAVLGNGLSSIYPSSHRGLARKMIDRGGLIFSQFEPDTKPYPSNFLNRNRLIAGLSVGTLVIEAGKRSGSLVTARYALEQGREVLVVPGSVHTSGFAGSNTLLRQGAALVTSVDDILEELPDLQLEEPSAEAAPSGMQLSELQQQIVEHLSTAGETRYEQLEQQLVSSSFAESILELELEGLIARVPGNGLVFIGKC